MDYGVGPELEKFRLEVREFVATNAPAIPYRAGTRSAENAEELALLKDWGRSLFEAGYVGGYWPVEFGGRGANHSHERDVVVAEEIARAQAPQLPPASTLVAAALIDFGTEAQRSSLLPTIRSGENVFCQLFSEPSSGSDLASLRTKAVPDGHGGFVVNGQKVWTTNGHWADYGYLLARTDPEAPKHKGISAFLVDMKTPGIDIRPLREMTGTADFNEVFFDDVKLPAEALIGEVNQGWRIANASLAHERSNVATNAVRSSRAVAALVDLAKNVSLNGRPAIEDASVQDGLGKLMASVDALSALIYANISRWSRGTERVQDAPMAKLMFSELGVDIARFALELSGERGVLVAGDGAVDQGRWQDEFLYARAYTIAGGSSEIMRNIIAERGLQMPR